MSLGSVLASGHYIIAGVIIMATNKIRVGIIGANVHYGWGSSAHIPALKALPEFELTAGCTSRQETADETAKHFGLPLAFHQPAKIDAHTYGNLDQKWVRGAVHHCQRDAVL